MVVWKDDPDEKLRMDEHGEVPGSGGAVRSFLHGPQRNNGHVPGLWRRREETW